MVQVLLYLSFKHFIQMLIIYYLFFSPLLPFLPVHVQTHIHIPSCTCTTQTHGHAHESCGHVASLSLNTSMIFSCISPQHGDQNQEINISTHYLTLRPYANFDIYFINVLYLVRSAA
jgi:hypothetical protein